MATVKVTVTLPQEQLDALRELVSSGQAASVSGFVQRAVADSLAEAADWERLLAADLEATGGPLTAEEQAWVDAALSAEPADR